MSRPNQITLAVAAGIGVMPAAAKAAVAGPALASRLAATGTGLVVKAQYIYGGQNYCWYLNGWQGPGWYWCGYAWEEGEGWGGGDGWNGWGGGRGRVHYGGGAGGPNQAGGGLGGRASGGVLGGALGGHLGGARRFVVEDNDGKHLADLGSEASVVDLHEGDKVTFNGRSKHWEIKVSAIVKEGGEMIFIDLKGGHHHDKKLVRHDPRLAIAAV
jgi:hypothetical protein